MAQILVRGIDDAAMEVFRRRAERLGLNREQLARMIIEREAAAETGWGRFEVKARRIRERLAQSGGAYDSVRDIREDRDR